MPTPFWNVVRSDRRRAFTLVEVLVAMTVLVILVGMIAQMTNGVASVVGLGQAHIDTDGQARALLDRMAIDFGAMVKRPDVDYYLKGRPTALTMAGTGSQGINDQIAFYSETPGYFPTSSGTVTQSSVSLIAYRVNGNTLHLERLCKGLAWNGAGTAGNYSMGFLPVPMASPLPLSSPLPSPTPSVTLTPLWPQAADPLTADPDYEELSPQIFRFEYYYILKGQNVTDRNGALNVVPSALSITPWNTSTYVNHTSLNGMQDVAGIGVLIAVIDPKSRTLVTKAQLTSLAALMEDAPDPTAGNAVLKSPGDIEAQWTTVVNKNSLLLPRTAVSAIQIYTRCFYLNGVSP